MTNTLLNLSGKIDKATVSALAWIHQVTASNRIPFFVVGATARDILFEAAHGIATNRATLDVDIAIIAENWDQFERITKELVRTKEFSQTRQIQRILYQDRLPVDIVPFGGVAGNSEVIEWPPDGSFRMSVLGFHECYQNAIDVKIADNPKLVIRVVSLAGLAMLKLIAWDDNRASRRKDAPDLLFIMLHYLDAGNMDRFFADARDIVEADEYDFEAGSARFLGRDIQKIADAATKTRIVEILERESQKEDGHWTAIDALQNDAFRSRKYEDIIVYFEALLEGLKDKTAS